MQMCNHYSMVLVPLYDTLGEQAVQVQYTFVGTYFREMLCLLRLILRNTTIYFSERDWNPFVCKEQWDMFTKM